MAVGSFSAGLSGLNANGQYLAVIGNNLNNSFVEPVFYDQPPRGSAEPWDDDGWRDDEPLDDAAPVAEPRRRGHLTVIDGGRGRPLAG